MEVYQPESPAARSYVPVSPRKKAYVPDPNTMVGRILISMKNPVRPMANTAVFKPVQNWESYVESLRRNMKKNGWDKDEEYFARCDAIIERIVKQHQEYYAEHPPKPRKEIVKGYEVPSTIDYVTVGLTVTKSGKVKAKISAPMLEIYEKYFSKGVKPPTDVYIRALKEFGYPNEVLEKVLLKAQNAPKVKAKMEAVIERVFGADGPSKSSKPKRGTVTQEITKRMKGLKSK